LNLWVETMNSHFRREPCESRLLNGLVRVWMNYPFKTNASTSEVKMLRDYMHIPQGYNKQYGGIS
jgi:hypothetical protein